VHDEEHVLGAKGRWRRFLVSRWVPDTGLPRLYQRRSFERFRKRATVWRVLRRCARRLSGLRAGALEERLRRASILG
jgi:hypothetical protein